MEKSQKNHYLALFFVFKNGIDFLTIKAGPIFRKNIKLTHV
jgi:hypothetical protein